MSTWFVWTVGALTIANWAATIALDIRDRRRKQAAVREYLEHASAPRPLRPNLTGTYQQMHRPPENRPGSSQ